MGFQEVQPRDELVNLGGVLLHGSAQLAVGHVLERVHRWPQGDRRPRHGRACCEAADAASVRRHAWRAGTRWRAFPASEVLC